MAIRTFPESTLASWAIVTTAYRVLYPIFFMIAYTTKSVSEQQLPNLKQMQWDIAKLLEMSVDEAHNRDT